VASVTGVFIKADTPIGLALALGLALLRRRARRDRNPPREPLRMIRGILVAARPQVPAKPTALQRTETRVRSSAA
jgi:hypothetical protein